MATNKVVAGIFQGANLSIVNSKVCINTQYVFEKKNVLSYEKVNETQRKSAISAIGRGAVGAALLGPVGLLAGLSAKNSNLYTYAVTFKDGNKCLIEMDKYVHDYFIKAVF